MGDISNPIGWLDGFCDAPAEDAGHSCVNVGSLYALIWPNPSQGSVAAQSGRLLKAGASTAILPARHGQSVASASAIQRTASQSLDKIVKALDHLGHSRQFTLMLPFDGPPSAAQSADLRTKHIARQAQTKALKHVARKAERFFLCLGDILQATLAAQLCAADKAAIHFLVHKAHTAAVTALWQNDELAQSESALIGPLPPFVFLDHLNTLAPRAQAS